MTALAVERRDGHTVVTRLHSAPPLSLRPTPDAVYLVGSAAGPVGGDDIRFDLAVRSGANLTIRSAAAALVLPGPFGRPSRFTTRVEVGDGGRLRWFPEPAILVRGCDHHAVTHLRLDGGSDVVWREEVVLGRHAERSGSLLQRLRVDLGGEPLLRNDLAVGPGWPGWDGACGVGDHRCVGTLLMVGPLATRISVDLERAAVLRLDGPAVLVSAVAKSPSRLRAVMDGCYEAASATAGVRQLPSAAADCSIARNSSAGHGRA